MILLYSREPSDRAELCASCGTLTGEVDATSKWIEFVRKWPQADCLVVDVPKRPHAFVADLGRLRFLRPVIPLVLISADIDNAPCILSLISADEVVKRAQAKDDLEILLQRKSVNCALGRIATLFEGSAHLNPLIVSCMVALCRARSPIHSVNALAREVKLARGTIERRFQAFRPASARLRLEDIVSGIRLYHVVRNMDEYDTWEAAAGDIGVDRRTLLAWGHRIAECTLRDLKSMGAADASRRVADQLFLPLL